MKDYDPSTIDALLESALLGKNKRTKLAAVGTLLASTDALGEVGFLYFFQKRATAAGRGGYPLCAPRKSLRSVKVEKV